MCGQKRQKTKNLDLVSCRKLQFTLVRQSVPSTINGPGFISFSSDKIMLFAMNFASNSSLDGKGNSLHDFLNFIEHKLRHICLTAQAIS